MRLPNIPSNQVTPEQRPLFEVKTHAPDLRVDDKFSRHRPPGTPDWHSKAKGISARAFLESTARVLEEI